NRLVQRHVGVERDVLLPGGRLDGGDDLAGNAQLSEGAKGSKLVRPEVANGFVEPDHAFLYNVFPVRANQKITPRFRTDEIAVFGNQIFECDLVSLTGEF